MKAKYLQKILEVSSVDGKENLCSTEIK